MDEVFAVIGKLYFDLLRANSLIEALRKQQEASSSPQSSNDNA